MARKNDTPTVQVTASPGSGGETHQQADGRPHITTNHGVRISDNQNSLKAGDRGPTLLEDFVLREKIFHFDHERIPERIVHARGSGAHGFFECTVAIPELTKASLFQKKGERVPLFTRFSTVAGGAGSVDTPRDVRGFAVKFYTQEGNWDLVGNNIPVFFIQDAIKFPDLIHSVKMEADKGYPQAGSAHDTFWDFVSLMPESTHMVMWAMSDRAIPRSLRMMEGFGVHTFQMINAKGETTFVKFHWRPKLGMQSTCWDEAVKIAGADPDFHRRDLFESIESGDFPEWELGLQVFDEEFAAAQSYDVLDATKLIPEEVLPLRIVGRMVLDRNVDNFFAETEQVAFLPTNVVPGIDFSNDPLLQGRLFSYLDTQKSRLGTTNFHQIPINAPKCPFGNFQRDGMMQMMVPKGRANYEPNSLGANGEDGGPRESPKTGFATITTNDDRNDPTQKLRVRGALFADHYSQARLFFRSQAPIEQAHLASAIVFELSKVALEPVRLRMISNLRNVDEGLAKRVADGLAMDLPAASKPAKAPIDMEVSDALSIVKKGDPAMPGRKVAILFDEGSDKAEIDAVVKSVEAAGGSALLIAPKVGGISVKGGTLKADGQLAGSPSVLFDAVAIILTKAAAAKLSKEGAAVQFVMDAYGHVKTIGHNTGAQALIDKAGVEPDEGVVSLADFAKVAPKRHWDRESKVRTLA
ncbi:catalase [Sphingomonas paeninsulae]|uniref:Catalase n=1 Tax=Sphingomonas paeninsulae TaxID=2319844 RepID=A0A494TC00_SPHPE|nr:catalase [Sphingomonas paeninsulae]AYJ86947.1 catalase [Sphingomonas paeninsulae]